jgi:hypothetical protein
MSGNATYRELTRFEGAIIQPMVTVRVVPFLVIFVALSATGKSQSKLTNAETPLSLEELKLYGDFLDSFLHTHAESTSVGLSERTVPLLLGPGDTDECSQGIGFQISKAVDQHPRPFPATITKGRPVHLVDPTKTNPPRPQEKVLSLSEIGFDDEHQFAVFTFKLVQVGASGFFYTEGGTLLFRKTDGKWTRTNKSCLGWIT